MALERRHGGLRAFTGKLKEITTVGATLPLVLSGPSTSPLKYDAPGALSSVQAARVVDNGRPDAAPIKIKQGDSTLVFASPSPQQEHRKDTNICDPADLPTVTPDAANSNILNQAKEPGVIAADAAREVTVNGKKYIFFSDSLVGTISQGHIDTMTGFIHNSALVNRDGKWESIIGGTLDKPKSLLPDLSKHSFKWIDTPIAENGKILIFDSNFDDTNPFGHFEGQSAIEVFSPNQNGTITHEETINLPPDASTRWGTAVVSDPEEKYRYIYGNSNDPSSGDFLGMKVARVQTGHTSDLNRWQYWNGDAWVHGASHASLIHTESPLTGITHDGSQYVAFSIPQTVFTDDEVDMSCANSPQGPWTKPEKIYEIKQVRNGHDVVAYMPTVFSPPPTTKGDGIEVVFSVNTTDGLPTVKKNVSLYQPVGIDVKP